MSTLSLKTIANMVNLMERVPDLNTKECSSDHSESNCTNVFALPKQMMINLESTRFSGSKSPLIPPRRE
jgi:hypothetical protein